MARWRTRASGRIRVRSLPMGGWPSFYPLHHRRLCCRRCYRVAWTFSAHNAIITALAGAANSRRPRQRNRPLPYLLLVLLSPSRPFRGVVWAVIRCSPFGIGCCWNRLTPDSSVNHVSPSNICVCVCVCVHSDASFNFQDNGRIWENIRYKPRSFSSWRILHYIASQFDHHRTSCRPSQ